QLPRRGRSPGITSSRSGRFVKTRCEIRASVDNKTAGGGAIGTHGVSQERAHAKIALVFREEVGRLTAAPVPMRGDFDEAEDLVQEALLAALEHWPQEGIPARPGAWLMTTARRKAIDRWRREAHYQELLARLAVEPAQPPGEPDDRLRLIFTCCHP